ncbi:MAG: penicillin-binding protein [Acidimicrobiales bacterium]|nr:penicillin-binding protein [Acidimicrobiales bacterium]
MARPDRFAERRGTGLALGLIHTGTALGLALFVLPPVVMVVGALTLLKAPLPGDLPEERPDLIAKPTIIVDSGGNEIGLLRGFEQTVDIKQADVPRVMKQAIVAIEDQRFWEHDGVDLEGVARAARVNLEAGGIAQGGSTITQQYVKNVYLNPDQTFERKAREALLAAELEQVMSKETILFRYLETSYYGAGAYGIGAAAEVYFGKSIRDIDVSEAATLAGIVRAPSRLSPREDVDAADARRRLVLQAMLDQGYIDEEEFEREAARTLWLVENGEPPSGPVTVVVPLESKGATAHPFFVDWIESELLDRFGDETVYRGGLTVETTIDPALQARSEQAVRDRLGSTQYPVEMASVTLDHTTGHVLSMVGGRDYGFSQVNLAIGGSTGFQPGSSFKPIVLAEAFSRGLSPETRYRAPASFEVPGCYGEQCTIENYDYKDRGRIDLREATWKSVNTVFAQLVLDVSIPDTVALARELGMERLTSDRDYGASLALGAAESSPLEMASAYGTFANRGVRIEPTGILRVLDDEGNVLLDNAVGLGERVLDEAVADHVTDVLVGVVVEGTGKRAEVEGYTIAGKTGTAQAYRAAWFVGYDPHLTTAVWMGHADKLASLQNINGVGNVTGGSHPAIAFSEIMAAALAGIEPAEFPQPAELPQRATSRDQVVASRSETVANPRSWARTVQADCGGPCFSSDIPAPALIAPPVTLPPTTVPDTQPPSETSAPSVNSQPKQGE